jgi:hypothetical protein
MRDVGAIPLLRKMLGDWLTGLGYKMAKSDEQYDDFVQTAWTKDHGWKVVEVRFTQAHWSPRSVNTHVEVVIPAPSREIRIDGRTSSLIEDGKASFNVPGWLLSRLPGVERAWCDRVLRRTAELLDWQESLYPDPAATRRALEARAARLGRPTSPNERDALDALKT